MANLAEELAALEPQIASLQRSNEERSLISALRARSQQIAVARKLLDETLEFFARIERLAGSTTGKPRASTQLRAKPAALRERLERNIEDVADHQQWDVTLLTPLEQFSTKLAEWVNEAWHGLVDRHVQPVREEVLDQFERLGFGGRVREVRAARDRIRELRNQLPFDDAALQTIIQLNDGIAKELGALNTVPAAVRAFFVKAAKQEAVLEDLNAEVQDWLRANDMLKLIRIGFR
jgi:hypothetical protein